MPKSDEGDEEKEIKNKSDSDKKEDKETLDLNKKEDSKPQKRVQKADANKRPADVKAAHYKKTPLFIVAQSQNASAMSSALNEKGADIEAAENKKAVGAKAAGEPDLEKSGGTEKSDPGKKGEGDPDSKKGENATFDEAVDLTGHGRFNHLVLAACGLVLLYTITESLGTGFMIPAAQSELKLSTAEKGLVNASTFIGIVMTAVMWGYLSDNYGRRKVMLPAIFFNVVFSLASSLSKGFHSLFLLRILTGCFVSASSATVFAYLGECTGNEHRAKYMAFGATFIAVSLIELPLLAWIIIAPNLSLNLPGFQASSWRLFMWSWVLPGIASIPILLYLPESPRFVYAAYGQKYALPILRRMYAINHGGRKDYPVTEIDVGAHPPSHNRGLRVAARNLNSMFHYPLLKCVLISHVTIFMVFMMASGMYTWMPEMLNEVLYKLREFKSLCKIVTEKYGHESCKEKKERPLHFFLYPVTIAMGAISFIVYLLIGMFVNTYGRLSIFKVLVYSGIAMVLTSSMIPVPIVAILLYITGLIVGIAPSVLAAIAVEVFPTSVRALALCTLYMMGRMGAAVGSTILGYGLPRNCELVFTSYTIAIAGSVFLFEIWPDPQEVRRIMEEKGFVY